MPFYKKGRLFEQLMKLLPSPSKVNGSETDEEMDSSYAGMASCFKANVKEGVWIIDSGASHHMTGDLNLLCEVKETGNPPLISLPTGETARIAHKGLVNLKNSIQLQNVLHVPAFKHNLLSVQKLAEDKVNFMPKYCIIQDNKSGEIRGVGKASNGLYYMANESLRELMKRLNISAGNIAMNANLNPKVVSLQL